MRRAADGYVYPRHTFQVLTKQPERMRELAQSRALGFDPESPPRNVWLGTSIENSRYVDRADALRETPAAVRFISAEPLLGPLVPHGRSYDDAKWGWYRYHCFGSEWNDDPGLDLSGIDWLIVGGESGPSHRPMRAEWIRDLRDAAHSSGTAFFFKQWGGRTPKAGGRLLDGREWNEYPRRLEAAV